MNYVEKKIKSGKMFEMEIYPVFPSGKRINGGTSPAQADYNRKNSIKRFVRLVLSNFDVGSYRLDPTYRPADAPLTEEKAKKDVNQFLRKLRRICRERKSELKYLYTTEVVTYKTGINKGRKNWHFHFFISAPGVSSQEIEKLWSNSARVNCKNFDPERWGQKSAAEYCVKDPQGCRRWSGSRNLVRPIVSVSSPKYYSQRRVEKLSTIYAYDAEYWQRKHPGYRFISCTPTFNEYNAHWYFYVEMRQIS